MKVLVIIGSTMLLLIQEKMTFVLAFSGGSLLLGSRLHRNLNGGIGIPPSQGGISNENNAVKTSSSLSKNSNNDNMLSMDELLFQTERLQSDVRKLEMENAFLHEQLSLKKVEPSQKIVLESFEGEGGSIQVGVGEVGLISEEEEWCDEMDMEDGTCPTEPGVAFLDALRSRASWLVGLLAMQSCSGFILARNEALLQTHPVIVYFLTMLVGAGGNAGNQASVRVIRGLALGLINEKTQRQFLNREFKMAFALSSILSVAGFIRAIAFRTPFAETVAVTTALCLIVFSSICLGAVLPLLLKRLGVDPAHSSTTIQVIMDILGVIVTVIVSELVLDSPLGKFIIGALSGTSLLG